MADVFPRMVCWSLFLWLQAGMAMAVEVTFQVEVPACTPATRPVYLRSNRLEAGSFIHDELARQDATRFDGVFEVTTDPAVFEYKYSSGLCSELSCPGIEKDLLYSGSGGDIAPRRLQPGQILTDDRVAIWRDALRTFDETGQPVGYRSTEQLAAFCGPYLSVSSTDGSLTLSHDTFAGEELVLDYGPTPALGSRLTSTGLNRNRFSLAGLQPDQIVHYRMTVDGVAGPTRRFQTPPPPGQPFRFAFLGDTQVYDEADLTRCGQVIDRILQFDPRLVVGVGDLVASSEVDGVWQFPEMGRWNLFFGFASELLARAPLVTAMGNHEEDAPYYWDAFAFPQPDAPRIDHTWFRYGHVHFTVLYTGTTSGYDIEGILDSQTAWLESVLSNAAQDPDIRFKVVLLHRGPFSQGANHPDDGLPFFEGGNETRPSWKSIWQQAGVDLVLAGHNHNFTLARDGDIFYITSCGGAPLHDLREEWAPTTLYAEKTCSADLLQVGARTLTFSAERPDGSVIEEASFVLCHQDQDCTELPNPCPSQVSWSCTDRTCRATCTDEPQPDGGVEPDGDAGQPDGDVPDADADDDGQIDGGEPELDAGTDADDATPTDGGDSLPDDDGATEDGGQPTDDGSPALGSPGGCDCGPNSSPQGFPLLWLWLLGLVARQKKPSTR